MEFNVRNAAAFLWLYAQIYKPKFKATMLKTIEFLRALCAVPCFTMARDKTQAAVRASFVALMGTDDWEVRYENQTGFCEDRSHRG